MTCAYCTRPLYEGQSAVYDELTDRYYCDKACHGDGFDVAEYQRKHLTEVDL